MQFTFLGTGTSQGVPVIGCTCKVCLSSDLRDKRLRSSALIHVDGANIVIDTGPDFRQQMLRENPTSVDAVLFTHEHKDHVGGLDDIRPYNFKSKKALDIYASANVQIALKREYHYVFAETKYPGVPQIALHTISPQADFIVCQTRVTPIEVLHYKLPVIGFRIKDVAYITDAKSISDQEKSKLQNLDMLVLNALRREPHISHFNLSQAVDMVVELKPKKAYFTHLSHLMGTHEEVSRELPANIFLAYDGLKVSIGD